MTLPRITIIDSLMFSNAVNNGKKSNIQVQFSHVVHHEDVTSSLVNFSAVLSDLSP